MTTFADELVAAAKGDFEKYGKIKEADPGLKERIGEYWRHLGEKDRDGGTDIAWSAAFISYMVYLANAGDDFPYSGQHSAYFYKTINWKLKNKNKNFFGYRPKDITVQLGDILGMNREMKQPIDYDWAANNYDYESHADIVVGINGNHIETIGGNVSNAIAKKTFVAQNGAIYNKNSPNQHVFVVIRSSLT